MWQTIGGSGGRPFGYPMKKFFLQTEGAQEKEIHPRIQNRHDGCSGLNRMGEL
jgi:hypothetical protein